VRGKPISQTCAAMGKRTSSTAKPQSGEPAMPEAAEDSGDASGGPPREMRVRPGWKCGARGGCVPAEARPHAFSPGTSVPAVCHPSKALPPQLAVASRLRHELGMVITCWLSRLSSLHVTFLKSKRWQQTGFVRFNARLPCSSSKTRLGRYTFAHNRVRGRTDAGLLQALDGGADLGHQGDCQGF